MVEVRAVKASRGSSLAHVRPIAEAIAAGCGSWDIFDAGRRMQPHPCDLGLPPKWGR